MSSSSPSPQTTLNDDKELSDKENGYGNQSEVTLGPSEDPKQMPSSRKWLAVLVISSAATCVTCASSIAAFAEAGEAQGFRVSREVTILGISLFVAGLGCGPLLLGPLSEFYGRNPVYWTSHAPWNSSRKPASSMRSVVYLIFRFLCGFSGSAFLSVAGGSVSDMFSNATVANPMAVYTLSPFIGPVLGPLISGFINQHINWRWTYRVQLIWEFLELIALILFVPETYGPILIQRKTTRLRRSKGQFDPVDADGSNRKSLLNAIVISCYKPFQLLFYDRMALFLDLWNALLLGILYLAFQAFPVIFEDGHGFNEQSTGPTFLGIGLGMVLALSTQPFWNKLYAREASKHGGNPPPEMRLIMGMPGGILVSIGLFWIAFTTYPHVHWIWPIIASIPFGTGIAFVFTTTFTYLVTAYRPIAASAMASNSALRSAFAAGFPLFAPAMYRRLGTVGATALLGGLTTLMAPLPFIFHRFGPQIRAKSRFAVS
ncbi:MFS transporter [Rickenella mellea]|uniref:MFS transporter n=1 Tax=Rickenella mellea TaxID=50990 RepID=A0A4Y7PG55_9AGAM|nr:MFS transporter [Rickenella mellea]